MLMILFSVQTGVVCPVFFLFVFHEFWSVTCKMWSKYSGGQFRINPVLLPNPWKIFLFLSFHLNRKTAAFRWYRIHWQLLLLQSCFMRTSEDTNWGIYLFFLEFLLCRYLIGKRTDKSHQEYRPRGVIRQGK